MIPRFLILAAALLLAVCANAQETATVAIANLTNRTKLATLKNERSANDRLLKCIAWLSEAKSRGQPPAQVITKAQMRSGDSGKRAALVRAGLLRNLDIAEKLGCTTPPNLGLMKRGRSPVVQRGPYRGELAEVDHIVPIALVPQLGNEIANLELMPRTLNRRKGAKLGQRQLDYLRRFTEAGLIDATHVQRALRSRR